MISVQNFITFFKGLFNALINYGDADSYKKAARTLSAAARVANAKYQSALKARPPVPSGSAGGGGFEAPSAGGSGSIAGTPPRPPGSPPSGGPAPPIPPYEDGIDFRVRSSWIAAFNFRPLSAGRGGVVQQYTGPRLPTLLPPNKGDLTMVVTRPSYPNPSGRYVYPNIPRLVMDQAVRAASPGRFYWRVLRYYSNRSLIGRRMRATGRRLKS